MKFIFHFFQHNKALNESPAMSQIEKINRERDSLIAVSSPNGKKYSNGMVSRPLNSAESNRNRDSKYKNGIEEVSKGKKKSSTTNEAKLGDPTSDVLASSRYLKIFLKKYYFCKTLIITRILYQRW